MNQFKKNYLEKLITFPSGSNGSYFLFENFSNSSLNSSKILKTRALNALPFTPPISTFSSLKKSIDEWKSSFEKNYFKFQI
jgi:hypothetical protein